MNENPKSPFAPRNGHTLVAGIVASLSGPASQKDIGLDDQVDHAKQVIRGLYDGPIEYKIIATKGEGGRLDRPEFEMIDREVTSGELDLLVMADLSRLARGGEAVRLIGSAVDHGTRVISSNDCIDTVKPTWDDDVLAACCGHLAGRAHTSRKLKHVLMSRFLKFGAATARPIYGYIVPKGAKTYDDWRKDKKAGPFILEGARLLKRSLSCSVVADYFNKQGVSPGRYCRLKKWNGSMVRRFYRNTLLKGQAARGFRHTVKNYATGRSMSVPNPDGLQYYSCPHLDYLDPRVFDELRALLARRERPAI